AATENNRGGRHVVNLERLLRSHDPPADVQAGQGACVGAGRENDVLTRQGPVTHLNRVRAGEGAPPFDVFDLPRGDEAAEAFGEPVVHAVLVRVDLVHVDAVQRRVHADLRTGISCVGNLSGVQQRLGGDAAGVQARAANLVGLDKGHTHTQLRTPKGRSVPTATGTQDR